MGIRKRKPTSPGRRFQTGADFSELTKGKRPERALTDKLTKKGWDKDGTGHRSMGCILLSEDDLTFIEKTWDINDGFLQVTTLPSVDPMTFGEISQPISNIPDHKS